MRKSLSLLLFFLAAQLFLGCSLDPKKDNPPANSYDVTFSKNDAAASGTMSPQSIASGSSAKLTANAFTKPGWAFTGWATTAGGAIAYVDCASYTMVNADVTLFATWAANGYTITFDKNDVDASGAMPPQTIASGSSAKLTANSFTRPGWVFTGWATTAGGMVAYVDGASYTMGNGDVALFATWTANGYTISFDKNDSGAGGTMPSQTIASGSSAKLTANAYVKSGWAFAGWATTAGGPAAYGDGATYTMGSADVTLFATWSANGCTITFDKNDSGATGTMPPQTIAIGSSAHL